MFRVEKTEQELRNFGVETTERKLKRGFFVIFPMFFEKTSGTRREKSVIQLNYHRTNVTLEFF